MSANASLLSAVTDVGEATPTMASPSWWGADTVRTRGTLDGKPVLVRRYTAAAAHYVNTETALAAACSAGVAGIAPAVLAADTTGPTMVVADLTDTHRTATLADVDTPGFIEALLRVRRSVAALRPTVVRESSVFDDIRELSRAAGDAEAVVPEEFRFFQRTLDDAEKRIEKLDYAKQFCHGDANLSNVMVSRADGSLMLVDWDWAAMIDPLQDLGAVLVELADHEDHARELFQVARGGLDEAEFARAMIYGYADHVRQALLGILVDALDPGTYEYSKYGDWQLLRARMALSTARCQELLRRIDQ